MCSSYSQLYCESELESVQTIFIFVLLFTFYTFCTCSIAFVLLYVAREIDESNWETFKFKKNQISSENKDHVDIFLYHM